MKLSLRQIAACLGLAEVYEPLDISGVVIDSREVSRGNLFVCLPGEKVDGHDYAASAQDRGCAAILAARPLPDISVPVLAVPDPAVALAHLAAYWRSQSSAVVICLTGTAGKTTLKETLVAIMSREGSVAATRGNQNNQLGLPLSILNATGDEDYWILEAGISHAGDMEFLASIARPDLAVILNVGPGHTEGLGARGVAWHKSRLLQYLSPGGRALVNGDIPELVAMCRETGAPLELFGSRQDCAYRLLENKPLRQTVSLKGERHTFATPFMGYAGGENALAACAAAHMLGASATAMAAGFSLVDLPPHRLHPWHWGRIHIFDDTYNANPLSMERMIAVASDFARERQLPLYLLLGEMGELGDDAPHWHERLGRQLAAAQPKAVFWKGRFGENVTAGMAAGGLNQELRTVDVDSILACMAEDKPSGLVLLAKGSRVNQLEKETEALQMRLEESHAL